MGDEGGVVKLSNDPDKKSGVSKLQPSYSTPAASKDITSSPDCGPMKVADPRVRETGGDQRPGLAAWVCWSPLLLPPSSATAVFNSPTPTPAAATPPKGSRGARGGWPRLRGLLELVSFSHPEVLPNENVCGIGNFILGVYGLGLIARGMLGC